MICINFYLQYYIYLIVHNRNNYLYNNHLFFSCKFINVYLSQVAY